MVKTEFREHYEEPLHPLLQEYNWYRTIAGGELNLRAYSDAKDALQEFSPKHDVTFNKNAQIIWQDFAVQLDLPQDDQHHRLFQFLYQADNKNPYHPFPWYRRLGGQLEENTFTHIMAHDPSTFGPVDAEFLPCELDIPAPFADKPPMYELLSRLHGSRDLTAIAAEKSLPVSTFTQEEVLAEACIMYLVRTTPGNFQDFLPPLQRLIHERTRWGDHPAQMSDTQLAAETLRLLGEKYIVDSLFDEKGHLKQCSPEHDEWPDIMGTQPYYFPIG